MDCEIVRELAPNYAAEELIGSLRERVENHLAGCAACAAEYRAQEELTERLDGCGPSPAPGDWFAERLLDRLARDNDAPVEPARGYDPAQLTFTYR